MHCLILLLLFLAEKFERFCSGNRQRLRQRILQELEKRLEQEDRALQHMALLQTARAESSRKESFLPEEEKKKASQRLQFLKIQRVQREELQAKRNERSFEQEKERLVRASPKCFSCTTMFPAVAPSRVFLFHLFHMQYIQYNLKIKKWRVTGFFDTCIKMKDGKYICPFLPQKESFYMQGMNFHKLYPFLASAGDKCGWNSAWKLAVQL